jgi:hypothetical protein
MISGVAAIVKNSYKSGKHTAYLIKNDKNISASADGGPRSGSAHARPSAEANPINFLVISGDSKHFLFFPGKNLTQNFRTFDNSFWEKSNGGRRSRRKRKNAVNRGHLVP